MDSERKLLKLCKPLSVKLTRISNSDINKWKQVIKHPERTYLRRRSLSVSQKSSCKRLKLHKNHKQVPKCPSSDNGDGKSQLQVISNQDSIMIANKHEEVKKTNNALHEIQPEPIDSVTVLPKNNLPIIDKSTWKYKRKRRRVSQSHDKTIQTNENKDQTKINLETNSLKSSNNDHETHVNLSKEIKIVSSRLEDSDDPQVEKWRSKKKTSLQSKSKPRLPPKSNSLNCTVCSLIFDNKEQLSNHIFKHTQRELQEAYKVAKIKLRESGSNDDSKTNSCDDGADECCDVAHSKNNQSSDMVTSARKRLSQITPIASSLSSNISTVEQSSVPLIICSCHTEHEPQNDASVQIEMVLFCETCHVLFRRNECFETHYRFSTICNADRTKGRTPKLFCSTCRVILNTLSNIRRHLEEHASENFHRTVTFVCNICRVVFFGVGTVFCTHWFNHEKDSTFVASRYSFPKLCVSTQGPKPSGSAPDELYLFVAEYVCRSCKFQFSSECELTHHIAKDCKGPTMVKEHAQSKAVHSKTIMTHSGSSKLNSDTEVPKNEATPTKPLNMIKRWICEFCDGSFPSRGAFEEHSSKHLQDDGYPGYSCVFQLNASTAFICNVCRSVHKTLQDLMKHWVTHDIIKFICTACNEKCSSYSAFETHISLGCGKSNPDCRVWFNPQQHPCKICKSMYKSAEALAHHYTSDHVVETDTNPMLPHNKSHPIVETTLKSGISTNFQTDKICPKSQATIEPFNSIENQTKPINLVIQGSLPADSTQSFAAHIEHPIMKGKPLQELGTIKITIPNVAEKSSIVCQAESINDPSISSSSVQQDVVSGLDELASVATPIINDSSINNEMNKPCSTMVTKIPASEELDSREATVNIMMRNTCLSGATVIMTTTANLPTGHEDNVGLERINIRDSHSRQSTTETLPNFESTISSNSLNDASKDNEISELVNGDDTSKIITKSKNTDNVTVITVEDSELRKFEEPEIIEIPDSLDATINTHKENQISHETKSMQSKNVGSERHLEKNCNPTELQSPHEEASNDKSSAVIESINEVNICPINPEASKPRGFLRVKKFTELQAVRNYICNLCAAAFDNVISLDEHISAHERRLLGNGKQPTMMAALILPQVEPSTLSKESVNPPLLPVTLQTVEKRILPQIPQRIMNANGRKASTLIRVHPNDKAQSSSIVCNSLSTQNSLQEQAHYTCPLCLAVFRCEDFSSHLAANHSNICLSNTNINSDSSHVSHKATKVTSTDSQQTYTCRICRYSTRDKPTITEHVRSYHLNQIQQNSDIVPSNSSEPVQHIDLTAPTNDKMNPNITPPFKCSLCTDYQYNTIEELSQHFQAVHYSIIRKDMYRPFVCQICFYSFRTYNELLIHANSHQNTGWT